MNSHGPLISVITVVYNRASQLEETMLSVMRQRYSNVEYIIIDGGSTDGTVDVIRRYETKIAKWISEPDKGIYDAMNKGIAMATGDWINFMNCGDHFASEESLLFFENELPSADVIYGDATILYPGFEVPWKNRPLETMWKHAVFCHQACFAKTELMKAYPFNTGYRVSSDFDFLYKLYLQGRVFRYIDQLICVYDFTEGASITNQFRSLRERKDSVLSHGFSLKKWMYYLALGLYLRAATATKRIIGTRSTEWITRSLRK